MSENLNMHIVEGLGTRLGDYRTWALHDVCYPLPTYSATIVKQTRTRYQADFVCAHQEKKRFKRETRLVDKEKDFQ